MKSEELKLLNKRRLAIRKKAEFIASELAFARAVAALVAGVTGFVGIIVGVAAIARGFVFAVAIAVAVVGVILFLTILKGFRFTGFLLGIAYSIAKLKNKKAFKVVTPYRYKLLKLSIFLFSAKTQKEVFEPSIADWQEEYFEALFKKEIWKARWINMRYTYAFLAAMWQKSPVGDLVQFVIKIAKQ